MLIWVSCLCVCEKQLVQLPLQRRSSGKKESRAKEWEAWNTHIILRSFLGGCSCSGIGLQFTLFPFFSTATPPRPCLHCYAFAFVVVVFIVRRPLIALRHIHRFSASSVLRSFLLLQGLWIGIALFLRRQDSCLQDSGAGQILAGKKARVRKSS